MKRQHTDHRFLTERKVISLHQDLKLNRSPPQKYWQELRQLLKTRFSKPLSIDNKLFLDPLELHVRKNSIVLQDTVDDALVITLESNKFLEPRQAAP